MTLNGSEPDTLCDEGLHTKFFHQQFVNNYNLLHMKYSLTLFIGLNTVRK